MTTEIQMLCALKCPFPSFVIIELVNHMQLERTFIAIKPDGVQRGLISEIIGRFERKGYKLVAIKLIVPTKEFAAQHYDDLSSRPFFNGLCDFLSSGPVVAMVCATMSLPVNTSSLFVSFGCCSSVFKGSSYYSEY